MDLLKRQFAPILEEAWNEIDAEARRVLALGLAGRKLVDFSGPHGWELSARNTGRLEALDESPVEGASFSRRVVQPLVELRVPFELSIADLDQLGRGGDPDLEPVVRAASKAALAEDTAIFAGLEVAPMEGILSASPHDPIAVSDTEEYPKAFLAAVETLREAGVGGPYGAALGPAPYDEIFAARDDGYPIIEQVQRVLTGPIERAEAVTGAVVVSGRGGDYQLTVGQDLSIGYAGHDGDRLRLFVTESFTFRVLDEAAAVPIRVSGG